jgi:hypothetical protein
VLYLRQEGPLTRAELETAIAPIKLAYDVIGEESRTTPVQWSVKSVPQDTEGMSPEEIQGMAPVFQWEVSSAGPLRGLQSLLVPALQVRDARAVSQEVARYSQRRPFGEFTSYKLALRQKVPSMPAEEVRTQARTAWNRLVTLPGSFKRIALVGQSIEGDRGEVPAPATRNNMRGWAIAAGVLSLVGIAATAMSKKGKR